MNLGNLISRAAAYWPDRLAVIDGDRRITYREFEERTNRLASGLKALGYREGTHVGVQGWNSLEVCEVEIACYKAGFIRVPINARLSLDETVHVINDGMPEIMIAGPEHADRISERRAEMPGLKLLVSPGSDSGDMRYEELLTHGSADQQNAYPDDDAIAVLHYTSGSSGVLKAAMQSFGNRRALVRKLIATPFARFETGEILAHVGPITHASGMLMMGVFRVGGTNLMLNRFDVDELLSIVEREKVTRLMMVPTMVNRVVNHPTVEKYDLSSLRSVLYGAAPIAPALVEKAIGLFGPILAQGYGGGETTSLVTVLTEQDHVDALRNDPRRLSSCGRCYFETDVQILNDDGNPVNPGEVGEIVVKGPDVMKGYYNAPEISAGALRDGAYLTGDLAVVDEEGFIYIVDRKKEMIISGGFNVYPTEVERIIYAIDGIYEVAVVGVPDEEWGEAIKAVVSLKPGAALSEEDILSICREKLPGFKRPRSVDFVDSLPTNNNGKIVRREVRDRYWADKERKVN
ncbi:MAG: AMP-binding protein [Notoacmeibacter sp.]|nr:AMP-binding protein [Notoacmeibacter sp.]